MPPDSLSRCQNCLVLAIGNTSSAFRWALCIHWGLDFPSPRPVTVVADRKFGIEVFFREAHLKVMLH
jgi:hypothetical protein